MPRFSKSVRVGIFKLLFMKKTLLFISLTLSSAGFAQNSIQPNFGLNIWRPGGLGNDIGSFFEVGVDYEHGVSDQFGLNGGLSYNFSRNSLIGGFLELNAGARYNLNELNDGFFVGGDFGVGFTEGANIMTFGANLGYSISLGNGSLNPNVSLGYMSFGSNGYRFGGLFIPLNVSYSIQL